jgi:hypothetical protein
LKLQDELASTESNLTARTRFNESVKPYTHTLKLPNSYFAGMFISKKAYNAVKAENL